MSTESKSSVFRLKVQLAGKALLLPISSTGVGGQVFGLAQELATRFGVERVAELRTGDGFLINFNDNVKDVIESGDILVGLDYQGYLLENNDRVRDGIWHSVRREDFVDKAPKWADCGWSKPLKKFFIRLGGAKPYFPDVLEMFSLDDLQHFAKAGKHPVAKLEKKDWVASAEFEINAAGVVEAVELSVKSKSDARAHVSRLGLKLQLENEVPVAKGDEKLVQDAEMPAEEVKYDIPDAKFEGPTYQDPVFPDKRTKEEKDKEAADKQKALEAIHPEGSLPMTMVLKSPVEVQQIYSKESPVITHHCQAGFEFMSRGDSLVINKTVAQFKDSDGKWVECKFNRGRRNGAFTYAWERDSNTAFTLYGKSPTYIAFNHIIECKGLQFAQRRRAAGGLPDPTELKLIFTDVNGGSSSFTYFHKNPPLPLRCKAEALTEETADNKLWGWLQCDDTISEGRLTMEAFVMKDNQDSKRRKIEWSPVGLNNATYTARAADLARWGFEAAEKNVTEIALPEFSQQQKPNLVLQTSVLCDPKLKRAYAFRIHLKTNSSSATGTFLIPAL